MARSSARKAASDDQPYRDRNMSLAGHLVELRKRMMIGAAALLVGMIVSFIFTDHVISLINQPIEIVNEGRGGGGRALLTFTTVTSGFDLRMRMAFAIGLLISAPVWLWQIWAFIMPGLTRKEVRYTVFFMVAAVPLFAAGCATGWLVAPHIIEVMAGFVPEEGVLFYTYDQYYDFVLKLFLALGIAFVTPVFLVALNLAGILSARDMLKGWRFAIVIATAFAGVATPAAEITSMLILAGILSLLYLAAVGVSYLFDRARREREAKLEAAI